MYNDPKPVHLWEINGFVKLSDRCRNKLKKLIREYGVRKLAIDLGFDRETIFSIYSDGRKKRIHSIPHLIKIANKVECDLDNLEKEVIEYGRIQQNMYKINFPFIISPLHLRAITIHGDGCLNKLTNNCSWYQIHKRIFYMEYLLRFLLRDKYISSVKKDNKISYITIPSALVYLVCKSINITVEELDSIKFFERVCQLSEEFQFQVFSQFIIDESNFKNTTFTVSQWNKESRKGFIMLLDNLNFKHSNPKNNKDDITIYGINFPRILNILDKTQNKYGEVGGFWFKEERFRKICEKADPLKSLKIIKNRI